MSEPPVGWFIFNFIIFVGGLYYLTRKPVAAAFAQRHETIKRAIAEGEAAFSKAKRRFDEVRGKLTNVEQEASQLRKSTKEQGQLESDRIVAAAQQYADRMRKDSEALVDQELANARLRLRTEAAKEALRLAEENLRRELTAADQERLLEDAIGELETSDKSSQSPRRSAASRPSMGGVA